MAGIYIHIPFCKQACSYCDFHFSTSLAYKHEMIQAIRKEIELAKAYVEVPIESIYFGGGTPSLLSADELNIIVEQLHQHFDINSVKEVTLEANPDDLNATYLRSLKSTPINRLSIGIQSFQSDDLRLMNRAHTASVGEYAIKLAQDIGYEQLSCDLIFGTPSLQDYQLLENIQRLASYDVGHISAYALTIEDRTVLAHQMQQGKFTPSPDAHYVQQMMLTMDELARHGFEQYEISNYARNGAYAVHNSNYWKGVPYLGLGPSAHSYNGTTRQWNVRNNAQYIKSIIEGVIPFELEELRTTDRYNEYVMTSLRTVWGLSIAHVSADFGTGYVAHLNTSMQPFIEAEQVCVVDQHYYLTRSGKLMADAISSALFMIED